MDKPIKLIQISDTHLLANPQDELLKVKTHQSFLSALNKIKEKKQGIDLIVHSGDISQDGSRESYAHLSNSMNGFNVPVYCIPGNHDNVEAMQAVYPHGHIFYEPRVTLGRWQILLLNSQILGENSGALANQELNFVEKHLEENPDLFTVIVMHHHPVFVQSEWLDKLGLKNADTFWNLVSKYPQTKLVLFGHVHQVVAGEKKGITYLSAPSTCIQFKNLNVFKLEKLPPGFRWIDLYPDGSFQSAVERVNDYVGEYDGKAKGY